MIRPLSIAYAMLLLACAVQVGLSYAEPTLFALSLAVLLAAATWGLYVLRRFVLPLRQTGEHARQVAAGNCAPGRFDPAAPEIAGLQQTLEQISGELTRKIAFMTSMLENTPTPMAFVDQQGKITWLNQLMVDLTEASGRGVVIVNCTQCLRGTVDQGGYEAGSALARAGVVSGADMTPEAALTKMIYLFSLGLSPEDIRTRMPRNLRGELTENHERG